MKKMVMVCILLMGCAHHAAGPPVVTVDVGQFKSNAFQNEVSKIARCLDYNGPINIHVSGDDGIRAFTDGETITITRGFFRYPVGTVRFVIAHEIAHDKLGHRYWKAGISIVTSVVVIGAGAFVPGAEALNDIVNPTVTTAFSRQHELAADEEAAHACICLGMTHDQVIDAMYALAPVVGDKGGFWDNHPAWMDRIEHVQNLSLKQPPEQIHNP